MRQIIYLQNIARFFGHLFATDSILWMVFDCVKINEDDTTTGSSSRIFVKIMMQEMMEGLRNGFEDSCGEVQGS